MGGRPRPRGDPPQPLLADGRDPAPLHRLLAQAGEGPLGVGKTEVPRSPEGEVDERLPLLVGELRGTPRAPLGLEHRHPVLVEGADHPANGVLAGQADDRDSRWGFPWSLARMIWARLNSIAFWPWRTMRRS